MLSATLICSILLAAPVQETPIQMTTYQMVFLRRGTVSETPGPEQQQRQSAHLERLAKLNRDRINLLYGPFLDEGDLRGVVVLDVKSPDEARQAMADDPLVKAGHLAVDVKPWFGPKDFFGLPSEPPTFDKLIFGFLMRGPRTDQPASEAETIQKGHLAYMAELHKQGKLLLAGPFMDDSAVRGIVIYRVDSLDEAKALASGDPAVKAGRLVLDPHPWMTFKGILR